MVPWYDKITTLVHEGEAGDVVYLDFSKSFSIDSHKLFTDKLKHWLDRWIASRMENRLNRHAQRSAVFTKLRGSLGTRGAPPRLELRPIRFSISFMTRIMGRMHPQSVCRQYETGRRG